MMKLPPIATPPVPFSSLLPCSAGNVNSREIAASSSADLPSPLSGVVGEQVATVCFDTQRRFVGGLAGRAVW